jgi:hypothetical protein
VASDAAPTRRARSAGERGRRRRGMRRAWSTVCSGGAGTGRVWTEQPDVDGPALAQSAALELLPEVAAGVLAAGVDEPAPDEELSEDDEELEVALPEADEVVRLSVR